MQQYEVRYIVGNSPYAETGNYTFEASTQNRFKTVVTAMNYDQAVRMVQAQNNGAEHCHIEYCVPV